MDKVSMSYLFSFSGYQTKCVLSSYLGNWWCHELQDLPSIIFQSNGRQVEKEGRRELQKIFLDEIKSIFHSFWMVTIWWKNKNLMKIVGTNFKWIQADAFQNDINDVDTRVLQINYAMDYQSQQQSKVQSTLWTRGGINLCGLHITKTKPKHSWSVQTIKEKINFLIIHS